LTGTNSIALPSLPPIESDLGLAFVHGNHLLHFTELPSDTERRLAPFSTEL
jgi:hypothetical protein